MQYNGSIKSLYNFYVHNVFEVINVDLFIFRFYDILDNNLIIGNFILLSFQLYYKGFNFL